MSLHQKIASFSESVVLSMVVYLKQCYSNSLLWQAMLVHKRNQCTNHLLALRNQVDASICLRTEARPHALVDAVIFIVNVSQFYNGNSCLELSLVKIFKELNECVAKEEQFVFVGHTLEILDARV